MKVVKKWQCHQPWTEGLEGEIDLLSEKNHTQGLRVNPAHLGIKPQPCKVNNFCITYWGLTVWKTMIKANAAQRHRTCNPICFQTRLPLAAHDTSWRRLCRSVRRPWPAVAESVWWCSRWRSASGWGPAALRRAASPAGWGAAQACRTQWHRAPAPQPAVQSDGRRRAFSCSKIDFVVHAGTKYKPGKQRGNLYTWWYV